MTKAEFASISGAYVNLCREKVIRVLHVDDDADFLAVAKQCLEEPGLFEVETALSAEEALSKLRDAEYDVIVADYKMPGKTGLELLRELRRNGNNIPFILFTCKGKEEIAIEALNSGVFRYVRKEGHPEATYAELKRSICEAAKGQRAEKLLREAENRLRLITENIQEILLLVDRDLVITYASASVKWVLGYEPDKIVGKSITEFIHPDDLPTVLSAIEKVFMDCSGGKLELCCKNADGSYALMDGASKVLMGDGKVAGIIITAHDITEQKRIEQALKESEEKYRALFEEALDAIFVADAETGILVDCNRAATELVGRSKSELIGMHQCFLHPPESIDGKFSKSFMRHCKECGGFSVEEQIITKTGEIRDVSIKANLIEVGSKKLLFGVFRDITDVKRVSERNRLQARLLNAVGQAIIATDVKGRIVYWNRGAEKLYGWKETEVLWRYINDVISAESAKEQAKSVMDQLLKGEHWSGEFIAKKRDGNNFPTIMTYSPIVDDRKKIIGTICVATDISEQKWMQQVTNEALQKVVELNEKLHVVESLTRHDIRNKLSALNGYIYILKKRLGDKPEILQQLKDAELISQQILRIIAFEKTYVQVGSEELSYVDVERYINEAASLFSDLKGATLVNECRGLIVLADSVLRQLFYNLIDNTLKYGKKTSKIRVYYKEEENHLKLVYEDDGIGIPENIKKHLFQEGYGTGTGYGLYLIKKICQAYGWAIEETGKEGECAQFTITIPKITKDGKVGYKLNS
ncbi:MAG: PAS domain S-box protein [Candidatus Bathyarchaeota archaeon]|nr:PAS domain S-box protein [Candidatus Bathyarchaeota archaeon]